MIRVGRFSPAETAKFGRALGSVGYIAVGPIALLVVLPGGWAKEDVVVTLADLNGHLRRVAYLRDRFGISSLSGGPQR